MTASLAAGFALFAAPFAVAFVIAARRLHDDAPLPPLRRRHPDI